MKKPCPTAYWNKLSSTIMKTPVRWPIGTNCLQELTAIMKNPGQMAYLNKLSSRTDNYHEKPLFETRISRIWVRNTTSNTRKPTGRYHVNGKRRRQTLISFHCFNFVSHQIHRLYCYILQEYSKTSLYKMELISNIAKWEFLWISLG
jgi:hypothetical protein